jgi:hypothetical protein
MLALEWTVWLGQTSRDASTFFVSNRDLPRMANDLFELITLGFPNKSFEAADRGDV